MIQSMISRFAAACSPGEGVPDFIPTWYKYLEGRTENGVCSPQVSVPESITPILLAIFELVLFIGGLVAVGFIIYGGIQYIISQGEPDRIKNARTTIVNAIIGLVIAMLSASIVNLIARNIGS
jgi:hypothetical protein